MKVDGRLREYRLLIIHGLPHLLGYGVNLADADLDGANLAGMDLSSVNLRGANLTFADLAGADLSFADLTGANLAGASLRGATLRGTVTRNATLLGADLRGAMYDRRSVRGAYLSDELTPEYLTSIGLDPTTVVRAPLTDHPRGIRMRDYDELLEELTVGIANLATSETWTKYLDVQSRFHTYSPSNVMLIMLQDPSATRVAGYRAWRALDHQVLAKETGIRILAPIRYKTDVGPDGETTSELRGFKMVSVFDISQTEGPDLPEAASKLRGAAPEGVFTTLSEFANSIGFRVERPEALASGANGDCTHELARIRIAASNSDAQQAKTLAHEISHALLHDPDVATTKDLPRGLIELEAESAAYVICSALGMDSGDYSFGYVAGWAGGAPEAVRGIRASTKRIQRASAAVLRSFDDAGIVSQSNRTVAVDVARDREILTRVDAERLVDVVTVGETGVDRRPDFE